MSTQCIYGKSIEGEMILTCLTTPKQSSYLLKINKRNIYKHSIKFLYNYIFYTQTLIYIYSKTIHNKYIRFKKNL